MTLPLRFGSEAQQELTAAVRWYEQRRPGLGAEFLARVDELTSAIQRWPHIGTTIPGLGDDHRARRTPVPRFPYHVVYVIGRHELRILAVAHDRRDPTHWQT
ncbi:type II toxin-antitoxin system RelE/ParE family toxin, partial [Nitriliruptor sp.]|uniref:type II toxin-antitoxin system RelE/ParE family toxin n=1 Tax=Nitriliruptor sp. TaxID=2448056 RepID=UPI0034A02C41